MLNMFNGLSGKTSLMRVCTFIIVIAITLVWTVHNIMAMISGAGWIPMGVTETGLIVAVLGVKAAQRAAENNKNGNGNGKVTN